MESRNVGRETWVANVSREMEVASMSRECESQKGVANVSHEMGLQKIGGLCIWDPEGSI